MLRTLALTLSILAAFASSANAAATPSAGPYDIRVRNAVYNPDQVYLIETDIKFATTIHFGRGERFKAVIAGDTESFEITPVTNLGNVVSIKPHVRGAVTNMTVITNRRTYSFELREGKISGRTGRFYEVRFRIQRIGRVVQVRRPKASRHQRTSIMAYQGKAIFSPSAFMMMVVIHISRLRKALDNQRFLRPTVMGGNALSTGRSKTTPCAYWA
jgi:type IV secretion system protein VirB9